MIVVSLLHLTIYIPHIMVMKLVGGLNPKSGQKKKLKSGRREQIGIT